MLDIIQTLVPPLFGTQSTHWNFNVAQHSVGIVDPAHTRIAMLLIASTERHLFQM